MPDGLPVSSGGAAVARAADAWHDGHSGSVSIMTVWQFLQRIRDSPILDG
jgi:hypothetical protein